MKKLYFAIFFFCAFNCMAIKPLCKERRAFDKGSLLLSISEGSTSATYTTSYSDANGMPRTKFSSDMDGIRDPLFIEFGISRRWGIGLSTGSDIFQVDGKNYYGIDPGGNGRVEVKTSEFTFDLNYHLYTSKRKDVSVYASMGSFGAAFSSMNGESKYQYDSKGGIFRLGLRYRYYFWGRLGALLMLSTYSAEAKSSSQLSNTYTTGIKGTAAEFGLCFRFF